MAAAAQEPKAEYAPDEFRYLRYFFSLPFAQHLKIMRDRSVPMTVGFIGEWNSPDTESTHNWKGNALLCASVIDDYHGTEDPRGGIFLVPELMHSMPLEKVEVFWSLEDWAVLLKPIEEFWQPTDFLPGSLHRKHIKGLSAAAAAAFRCGRRTHGTGTGLAIACDKGGPYLVNKHTLTRNDWQFRSDRAADNLKLLQKHINDLAATCTTERAEIGLPPSLAGFKLSSLARVSEAANPGGATDVFLLDSGSSFHAVGEARIMQGIRYFPFAMRATLPDNSGLPVIGIGTIEMHGFSIPNVFLVERLRNNLISVSQLDIYHGMCSCFHGRQCTVMIPDGTVVGGAILEDDGMYQLRFLQVPQPEQ